MFLFYIKTRAVLCCPIEIRQSEETEMFKLYFGHPANTYNTPLEADLLKTIAEQYPGFDVINPNSPEHEAGYKLFCETHGIGRAYFFTKVLPKCNAGIFLPFRDGAWSIRVFSEAEFLVKQWSPVRQISPEGKISWVNLNNVTVLSIEETRARIRTATGETIPY